MNFKLVNIKNLLILSSIIAGIINVSNASDSGNDTNKYSQTNSNNNEEQVFDDNFTLGDIDNKNYQENTNRKKVTIGKNADITSDSSSNSSYYESNQENKSVKKADYQIKTIRDRIKDKHDCIGENCIQDNKQYSYSFESYATYSSSSNNEGKTFSKRSMQSNQSKVDENGKKYESYSKYNDSFRSDNGELISSDIEASAGFNNNGYTRDADVFANYNNKKGMDVGGNSYENKKQVDRVRKHYTSDEAKDVLCDGNDCYGKKLVRAGKEYINKALGDNDLVISPYDEPKCLDGDIKCINTNKIKSGNKHYKQEINTSLDNDESIVKYNKTLPRTNKSYLEDNKYDEPIVTASKKETSKDTVLNKQSYNNTVPLLSDKPAFKEDEYRKFVNDKQSFKTEDQNLNDKLNDTSEDEVNGPIEPLI